MFSFCQRFRRIANAIKTSENSHYNQVHRLEVVRLVAFRRFNDKVDENSAVCACVC